MKTDVLSWATGQQPGKMISKESLNHPGLIELVSGLDVYQHTREAYLRAYQALGIDIINRVPIENAPLPTPQGEKREHPNMPYWYAHLGVYDTIMRHTYPCKESEDVWALDMEAMQYEELLLAVPHSCRREDTRLREQALGDVGLYYAMHYTTAFMWGVEVLGWEIFMMAAIEKPDRFHDFFIVPCVDKSKAIIREIATATDSPFVFTHDDLASATGPMFSPSWYDDYIFPHYPEIWAEAKNLGKKVIFVADGNMNSFFGKLVESGVDGMMYEVPASDLDQVIEHFGQPGKIMIGGIDTVKLTTGTPDDVRKMVFDFAERTQGVSGSVISSCGGLHGNIPLSNLEAYFDARAEIGATPRDWRTCCHV